MRRDSSLLRRLLLDAEAGQVLAPDVSPDKLNRHIHLLHEAGYVQEAKPANLREPRWTIAAITWRGHEVLDAIRDERVWLLLEKELRGVPFEVVVRIAYERAFDVARRSGVIPVGP